MEHHISDLLTHPKVLETQDHLHHSIPKYDHLMRSVRHSYRFARWLRADLRVCVRAALIHDIDSRYGTLTTHGAIAAEWARQQGEPEAVCQAIVSHMYPLGGPAPTSREAWVLALADKAASFGDMTQFLAGLVSGTSWRERQRLTQSDPFYEPKRFRRKLRQKLGWS